MKINEHQQAAVPVLPISKTKGKTKGKTFF